MAYILSSWIFWPTFPIGRFPHPRHSLFNFFLRSFIDLKKSVSYLDVRVEAGREGGAVVGPNAPESPRWPSGGREAGRAARCPPPPCSSSALQYRYLLGGPRVAEILR